MRVAKTICTYILLGVFSVFLIHQSFPHHHHEETAEVHHHEGHTHGHDHQEKSSDHGDLLGFLLGNHTHSFDFAQFTLKKNNRYQVDSKKIVSIWSIENEEYPLLDADIQSDFNCYHSPPGSTGHFTFNQLRAPPFLG